MPDPDLSQLRFVLAKAREEQMLTQEELAARAGITRESVLNIGSGRSRGSIETWARLARALDIPLGDLISPIWSDSEADSHDGPAS
ncbi:helix-turn-helix transcriptional regulator [Leucobacter komagatae]|uniref:helix-turn-helix transcriptional regulator n=1 Tax=Leucobacter komagatae TaxID=55969 RepID=UPI003B22462F